MGRALAADQPRCQCADAERLERLGGIRFDPGVACQAQIIIIGEADEIIPAPFRLPPEAVQRGEERVGKVEDGFPR